MVSFFLSNPPLTAKKKKKGKEKPAIAGFRFIKYMK